MADPKNDGGRNIFERVGALEQDMAVARSDIARLERVHEQTPVRLTRLEQQFEHQNERLKAINEGQVEMGRKVDKMGTKITYGLGAAAVLMILFDKLWPVLMKGFGG